MSRRPSASHFIAMLLGHDQVQRKESNNPNVQALDNLFKEIVDDVKKTLPQIDFDSTANAVSRLIDAVDDEDHTLARDISLLTDIHHSQLVPPDKRSYAELEARFLSQQPRKIPRTSGASSSSPATPATLRMAPPVPVRGGLSLIESEPRGTALQVPRELRRRNHGSTPMEMREELLTQAGLGSLPERKTRRKRYQDATPSAHCHVCCRLTTSTAMAICSNIRNGTCRKVVCRRCIHEHGWNWENASREGSDWICPHCHDECGTVRAHCWVYKRTNIRRRLNGKRNKAMKAALEASPQEDIDKGSGEPQSFDRLPGFQSIEDSASKAEIVVDVRSLKQAATEKDVEKQELPETEQNRAHYDLSAQMHSRNTRPKPQDRTDITEAKENRASLSSIVEWTSIAPATNRSSENSSNTDGGTQETQFAKQKRKMNLFRKRK